MNKELIKEGIRIAMCAVFTFASLFFLVYMLGEFQRDGFWSIYQKLNK